MSVSKTSQKKVNGNVSCIGCSEATPFILLTLLTAEDHSQFQLTLQVKKRCCNGT